MAGTINVGTIQVGGLKELKAELKAVRDELLGATDPERMKELAEAAGELKDRINDANEQINVFATGSKFEAVSNSFNALKGDLMNLDFEGAAEKAQTFQKTVTSISPETISKGIQGLTSTVSTLGKTFIQFGIMLLTNPIFLLVAAITAIVVGIGALMNALGILQPIIDAVGAMFGFLGDVINTVINAIKEFLSWFGLSEGAAEEGESNAESRHDAEMKRSAERIAALESRSNLEQSAYQRAIDLAKAEGKDVTDLEKAKLRASITFQKSKEKELRLQHQLMKAQLEEAKLIAIIRGGDYTEYNKLLEQTKTIVTGITSSMESVKDSENQLKIIDIESTKTQVENAKKRAEAAADEAEKRKEALEKIKEVQDKFTYDQMSERKQELADIDNNYREAFQLAKKYGQDTTTLLANYNAERKAVNDQFDKEEAEKQKEIDDKKLADEEEANRKRIELEDKLFNLQRELDNRKLTEIEANKQKEIDALVSGYDEKYLLAVGNAELTKQLEEQQKVDLKAIDDKYKADQEKADEEARQKKIQSTIDTGNQIADWTKQGLSAVNDLVGAFAGESEKQQEKAFKVNKAANIAMAVIDTLKGAVTAYTSQIVAGDPTSIVRGAIAAAMVTAAGIANIKKIASTQFKGASASSASGGMGSGGGGGVQPATPQTNLFGGGNNMNTLQGAQSVESQPQVVKAVVVESDITSSQSRIKRMEENATL
jgi:hypothetical protein